MAIYCRTSGSFSSMLICCYSKYSRAAQKCHAKWKESVRCYSDARQINHLDRKNRGMPREREKQTNSTEMKHDGIINSITAKKELAQKSVLIHINSKHSIQQVHTFCSQYGRVDNLYQYGTQNNEKFVLVEFTTTVAVREAVNSANAESEIPMASRIFDFHHKAKNSKDKNVPVNMFKKTSESKIHQALKHLIEQNIPVSAQIQTHYELTRLTPLEEKLRYFILCQIENMFLAINPTLAVLPFGSTVNGFGKYNSDLDLVLVSNHKHKPRDERKPYVSHSPSSYTKSCQYLHLAAKVMPVSIPGIKNMCEILSARVPIIRFKHQQTELNCDLSMNQRAGLYMSELLHVLGEFDTRVRPLVLLIREWAKRRKLTQISPGPWITNFSLSLLLIFYFQEKKILPPVHLLRVYARFSDYVTDEDGKNYTFLHRAELLPRSHLKQGNESLGELLLGFFEYYSNFNFDKYSVCLQTGTPRPSNGLHPLFICNPFELDVNVSKNVNSLWLQELKKNFLDSLTVLRNLEDSAALGNLLLLNETPSESLDVTNDNETDNNDTSVTEPIVEESKSL